MNRPNAWKAVERSRTPYYKSMERLVRQRFRAERDAVVQLVESMPTASMAGIAAEEAIDVQQAEWGELLQRIYRVVSAPFAATWYRRLNAKSGGVHDVKAEIPPEVEDRWEETVGAYVRARSPRVLSGISATTSKAIRAGIRDLVDEGQGIDQIARGIRQIYGGPMTRNRARVIARTEVISASNAGGQAGALATGLVLNREWIATLDDRTRDAHAAADGDTVPMADPYIVDGDQLMFPGDTSLGAQLGNVIQCRCTEAYIPIG